FSLLQQQFGPRVNYCRSRTNFCEVIDQASSKWNAIKVLADGWGIQTEEIMAVGDQENDVSMLQSAGIGVAMGNAPDHVKAVANYVTDSIHEQGAANAIEKFVLGHPPLADLDAHLVTSRRTGT
ncbi:MAG: HAD hydrolase family protein, partial [Vampirovibrio sp.]|nr:HAD hydrolase family protein [Vampirovibrio sp.]